MARRPVVPPKTALKTFYVYDPGVRDEIGTYRVKTDKDGRKIVALTDAQAEYWVATGMLGRVPLASVTGSQRSMLHQLSGGRIPMEEGGPPGKLKRTAIQDPRTMAAALTEGYHPATGTRATSPEDNARAREMRNKKGKVTVENLR